MAGERPWWAKGPGGRWEPEASWETNTPCRQSWKKIDSWQSLSLKEIATEYRLFSGTTAIGTWAGQGTAWVHPAR